jgi:hypothetical protein
MYNTPATAKASIDLLSVFNIKNLLTTASSPKRPDTTTANSNPFICLPGPDHPVQQSTRTNSKHGGYSALVIPFLVLGSHNIRQFLNSKLSDKPQHPLLRSVSTTSRMLTDFIVG